MQLCCLTLTLDPVCSLTTSPALLLSLLRHPPLHTSPHILECHPQGTDVKMSGHFVYSSVQEFPAAAPLRCTNRQQVMEWLAGLGASEAAEENEVVLPDLGSHQWQALNTSDPAWARPKLDR